MPELSINTLKDLCVSVAEDRAASSVSHGQENKQYHKSHKYIYGGREGHDAYARSCTEYGDVPGKQASDAEYWKHEHAPKHKYYHGLLWQYDLVV